MSDGGARLEVLSGKAAGQSLFVTDELIIGRFAEGPGQLGGDEEISRSHARLSVDPSGFCAIEDLGSTNGTYVNGLRISAPQTLSEGDTIEFGGTTVVVQKLPELAGPDVDVPDDVPAPQPTPVSTATLDDRSAAPPQGSSPTAAALPPEAPPPPVAAPPPEEAPDETVAPLAVSLTIDVEARRGVLTLGDDATVHLKFEGGRWQVASTQSTDEGMTA